MTRGQITLVLILSTILVLCLAVKIDLITADLGRHIKNGEIILTGTPAERNAVLTTNFYSYTNTNLSFINHHWLSGVIFFLTNIFFGFYGLSILYIACMLIAFCLMFDLVRNKASPFLLFIISLFSIVVIASRAEVRPEVFSYLFASFFLWICYRASQDETDEKWLWSLPILQLFWINLHIGFIIGPFIVGVFILDFLVRRNFKKAKHFLRILFVSCVALLANPAFISGVLYPFKIFSSYSYRVFENQSIIFLDNLNMGDPFTFTAYKILLIAVLVSFILAIRVDWKKISLPLLACSILFGVMGWIAIRDFPLFGLVSTVAIVTNIRTIHEDPLKRFKIFDKDIVIVPVLVITLIIGIVLVIGLIAKHSGNFGIGLRDGVQNAAKFFSEQKIKGPVFNNYDIGGYLIYNLYPLDKVYFDNRPETYPISFVNDEYIRPMEDPVAFKKLDNVYNFNAIFFYYRDYTPWGQAFITQKVFDPDWAAVYADTECIILLKRSRQNDSIIHSYEIPKDSFKISQ